MRQWILIISTLSHILKAPWYTNRKQRESAGKMARYWTCFSEASDLRNTAMWSAWIIFYLNSFPVTSLRLLILSSARIKTKKLCYFMCTNLEGLRTMHIHGWTKNILFDKGSAGYTLIRLTFTGRPMVLGQLTCGGAGEHIYFTTCQLT